MLPERRRAFGVALNQAQSGSDGPQLTCMSLRIRIQASLIAQLVKNPPEIQETLVWFLNWEEEIGYPLQFSWTSFVAQLVKKRPAMWET